MFELIHRSYINKGRKQVRFSKFPPQTHLIETVKPKYKDDVWWSRRDLESFRSKPIVINHETTMYLECLYKVHALAHRVASNISWEDKLHEVLQAVPIGRNLSTWSSSGRKPSLRGLEKALIQRNKEMASTCVHYHKSIVQWQKTVDVMELQMLSQYLTRRDRVFARMLGQGDTMVHYHDLNSSSRSLASTISTESSSSSSSSSYRKDLSSKHRREISPIPHRTRSSRNDNETSYVSRTVMAKQA